MVVADLPSGVVNPVQEVRAYYELEGDSSHDLLEQFELTLAQWRNRPSLSVEPVDDSGAINHVPFKRVGTIKVRFKEAKPMKPRAVDFEEFEPE